MRIKGQMIQATAGTVGAGFLSLVGTNKQVSLVLILLEGLSIAKVVSAEVRGEDRRSLSFRCDGSFSKT